MKNSLKKKENLIFLTMFSEMLHHPPHHERHTILHHAFLSQLKQGSSKQLGVLGCYCPGSQYGYLDHLLHVFFNLHRCLVMLQGAEQRAAVRDYSTKATTTILEEGGSSCSIDYQVCACVWRWCLRCHLPKSHCHTLTSTVCAGELGGRGRGGLAVRVLLWQISGYHATPLVKGITRVTLTPTQIDTYVDKHTYMFKGGDGQLLLTTSDINLNGCWEDHQSMCLHLNMKDGRWESFSAELSEETSVKLLYELRVKWVNRLHCWENYSDSSVGK